MNLEQGKCAQCGHKLDVGYQADACNVALDRYASAIARPYFCSEECAERAAGIDRINAEFDRYEKHLEGELDHAADWSEANRHLKQQQHDRERLFNSRANSAYQTYFNAFLEKFFAKDAVDRSAQNAADGEKRRARIAADLAKDDAFREQHGHNVLTWPDATEPDYLVGLDYLKEYIHGEDFDARVSVPLFSLIPDPVEAICHLYRVCTSKEVRKRLREHLHWPLEKPITIDEEIAAIRKSKLSAEKLIDTLFLDTPLLRWLHLPQDISIPDKIRFEHTHILGGTGSGKTTLMQRDFIADLKRENPPGMIVIEPKGMMCKRLAQLEAFEPGTGRLEDRLIILDATDIEALPSLNLFAPVNPALPQKVRNRIIAQTIDLLEYVFSGADFKLTPKQSVGFSFVARLMFHVPNASITKLFELIEMTPNDFYSSEFARALEHLDDGTKLFFKTDFFGEFKETKAQLKGRLYLILRSPELMGIFNAPTRAIDWFDAIQKRKIILVNTGKEQLGTGASTIFGRYVIASVVAAVGGRTELPADQWHPTFMMVDEAQLFMDENKTQDMLALVREYCLGITLAHQQMTGVPLNDNIRASISTNTAIKYAAGVESADLSGAARDLRCDQEFIRAQRVTDQTVNFACYVRNLGLPTFRSSADRGNADKELQMPPKSYARLIRQNRYRVCPSSAPWRKASPSPASPSPAPTSKPTATPTKPPPKAAPSTGGLPEDF